VFFAVSQNCTSVSRPNVSPIMKINDSAVQCEFQFLAGNSKLDNEGVFCFVRQRPIAAATLMCRRMTPSYCGVLRRSTPLRAIITRSAYQALRNSFGSLAIFAASRRASLPLRLLSIAVKVVIWSFVNLCHTAHSVTSGRFRDTRAARRGPEHVENHEEKSF